MSDQQLHSEMEKLRAEVNLLTSDNVAAKAKLNNLISDIETRLENTESGPEDDGLMDSVKEAITHFETEHPRATAILNDIMVTLSNMGI